MHWRPHCLLALLVVLTTLWRLPIARDSLWIDELHTSWCAGGDLQSVAPRATIGNQSPLYFWLLWAELRVAPPSELALRAPSLIAGSLLLIAAYWIAATWLKSPWLGLLAAWLIALEPEPSLFAYYATEARPYALAMLLAAVHVALFARLCRRPTVRLRTAFVLGAALLFYLHFTTALIVPAELAYWGLARWTRLARVHYSPRQLTLDLALIGAAWLPAALTIGGILSRRQNWAAFVEQRPLLDIFELLPWSAAALLVLAALGIDSINRRLAAMPQLSRRLAKAPRRAAHDLTPAAFHRGDLRTRQFAVLCLCWLLVPLGLAWLATWTDTARLFFPRYLLCSLTAAVLLAITCVRLAPGRAAQVFVGCSLAAAALWLSLAASPITREENWRSQLAFLNERWPQQPYPVLLMGDLIEDAALQQPHAPALEDYCLFPISGLYEVKTPRAERLPLASRGKGLLRPEQQQWLRTRGGAWLIVRTREQKDANEMGELLASELGGKSATSTWDYTPFHGKGVHLLLVQPRR